EAIEDARVPDAARDFLNERYIAELPSRVSARVFGGFAAVDALLDVESEMRFDLRFQFLFPPAPAREAHISSSSGCADSGNGAHHLIPAGLLRGELPLDCRCQAVILRLLVVLGQLPLGANPSLLLETIQRGIQGTCLHLKQLGRL